MEQQMDAFTQKRFELMIEMATKKLQQEIAGLKEHIISLNSELGSLKSQVSRMQFQPQGHSVQRTLADSQENVQSKKEVKIVDCRPENERKEDFKSGAAKNTEPIKPRYGDYQPDDVSIDKFFYFGRK
ncbi:hypothetical protein HYX07_02565 [Candidatus Woesearchaeota archaeon]|nr:hypothetical protein [Candidatus Woesearchaeota archaeon]